MRPFPETRPSMPAKLARADDAAWVEFFRLYAGPSLDFLTMVLKVEAGEAEDLLQEALLRMPEVAGKYDAASGLRFRTLLKQVLCTQKKDWLKFLGRQKRDAARTVEGDAPVSRRKVVLALADGSDRTEMLASPGAKVIASRVTSPSGGRAANGSNPITYACPKNGHAVLAPNSCHSQHTGNSDASQRTFAAIFRRGCSTAYHPSRPNPSR